MSSLYQITDKRLELLALAEESEDMVQAVSDTMESLDGEFEDKARSLMAVVSNMSSDVLAIDSEVKRLVARKKAIENKQDCMRDYLKTNMEASNINKIKCPLFTITLAKGRDIVQIDDESKIPADYLIIETSMSPMKKEILAALKNGDEINGVSLAKSPNSIRIK